MQLSLAQAQPRQTTASLARAYRQARVIMADSAAIQTALPSAIAFVNAARPTLEQANFAAQMHLPSGVSASLVIDQTLSHFTQLQVRCQAVYLADVLFGSEEIHDEDMVSIKQSTTHSTTRITTHNNAQSNSPASELAGELTSRGYVLDVQRSLHVLGRVPGEALNSIKSVHCLQIIPGRSAYSELRKLWLSEPAPVGVDAQHACEHHIDTLDDARVECFLARLNGQPVGVVKVIAVNQSAVIDDLFVLPSLLHEGIGHQLLDHAFSFCVRSQAQSIVMACQTDSPEQSWLSHQGFTCVASLPCWRLSDD